MAQTRYRIYEKLGAGGVGAIYRAYDTDLKRWVAIKRLLGDDEDVEFRSNEEELRREANSLAALHHPNIVSIYDVASDEDGIFLVMELIDGDDLSAYLQNGPMDYRDFRELAMQSLEGLQAAHYKNFLHRDIKPENIKVSRLPSGRLQVKLIDFGLARAGVMSRTQTEQVEGLVLGSVNYMAPEQLSRRPIDERTDLYSLGCVFYEALSGRRAVEASTTEHLVDRLMAHDVVPLKRLATHMPEWLCAWVDKMFAAEQADRFQNTQEAIESFLRQELEQAEVETLKTITDRSNIYTGPMKVVQDVGPSLLLSNERPRVHTQPLPLYNNAQQITAKKSKFLYFIFALLFVLAISAVVVEIFYKESITEFFKSTEAIKKTISTKAPEQISAEVDNQLDLNQVQKRNFPPASKVFEALNLDENSVYAHYSANPFLFVNQPEKVIVELNNKWHSNTELSGAPSFIKQQEHIPFPKIQTWSEVSTNASIIKPVLKALTFHNTENLSYGIHCANAAISHLTPLKKKNNQADGAFFLYLLSCKASPTSNRISLLWKSLERCIVIRTNQDSQTPRLIFVEGAQAKASFPSLDVDLSKPSFLIININSIDKKFTIYAKNLGATNSTHQATAKFYEDLPPLNYYSFGNSLNQKKEVPVPQEQFNGELAEFLILNQSLSQDQTADLINKFEQFYLKSNP
jgi:serine/threonine protein kinase